MTSVIMAYLCGFWHFLSVIEVCGSVICVAKAPVSE